MAAGLGMIFCTTSRTLREISAYGFRLSWLLLTPSPLDQVFLWPHHTFPRVSIIYTQGQMLLVDTYAVYTI